MKLLEFGVFLPFLSLLSQRHHHHHWWVGPWPAVALAWSCLEFIPWTWGKFPGATPVSPLLPKPGHTIQHLSHSFYSLVTEEGWSCHLLPVGFSFLLSPTFCSSDVEVNLCFHCRPSFLVCALNLTLNCSWSLPWSSTAFFLPLFFQLPQLEAWIWDSLLELKAIELPTLKWGETITWTDSSPVVYFHFCLVSSWPGTLSPAPSLFKLAHPKGSQKNGCSLS